MKRKPISQITLVKYVGVKSKCRLGKVHVETMTDQSDVVMRRTDIGYLLKMYQQYGIMPPQAKDDDFVNMSGVPNNNIAENDLDAYRYNLKQKYDALKSKSSITEKEKTEKKEKQQTEQTADTKSQEPE